METSAKVGLPQSCRGGTSHVTAGVKLGRVCLLPAKEVALILGQVPHIDDSCVRFWAQEA